MPSGLLDLFQELVKVFGLVEAIIVCGMTILLDLSGFPPIAQRVRRYTHILGGFFDGQVLLKIGYQALPISFRGNRTFQDLTKPARRKQRLA